MIPEKNAPPFPGYVNEYFSFEEQTTTAFYHKSKELEAFFLELKNLTKVNLWHTLRSLLRTIIPIFVQARCSVSI